METMMARRFIPNRRLCRIGALAVLGIAGFAAAPCAARQDQNAAPPPAQAAPRTPPANDPELDNPRLDEDAKAIGKQRTDGGRVSPSADRAPEPTQPGLPGALEALPGLEGTDYLLHTPVIRSEGVFLTLQRGTVVKGRGGEWWFVFHGDAQRRAERPMILLPCQTLEQMAAAAEGSVRPVFRASGQVFVYYGRNYFLPTTAALAGATDEAAPDPFVGPPSPADDAQSGTPDEERGPTVEQLIDELTGDGDQARALGPQVGGGAGPASGGTGGAGSADLTAEGTLVARRRGRMVRQSAAWAFAFDNDTDGGPAERPMVMAPSLNLEAMERIAAKQGDAVVFELSGRVLAYRGRNYIIPTMFQVVRDREVRPLQ